MDSTVSTELQSHFLRLYQIACSDNDFDVLEMKQLYKLAELRGISTEHLDNILINPLRQLEVPASLEKRVEYLYDLAIMIWIDKVITDNEYNLLKKYCGTFGFLPENITGICDYLIDCAKQDKSFGEVITTIL